VPEVRPDRSRHRPQIRRKLGACERGAPQPRTAPLFQPTARARRGPYAGTAAASAPANSASCYSGRSTVPTPFPSAEHHPRIGIGANFV
jgi:hypothetical protein